MSKTEYEVEMCAIVSSDNQLVPGTNAWSKKRSIELFEESLMSFKRAEQDGARVVTGKFTWIEEPK